MTIYKGIMILSYRNGDKSYEVEPSQAAAKKEILDAKK